jgi:AcrR family transcriptional regulator
MTSPPRSGVRTALVSRQETRQFVLSTARGLFRDNGVDHTTMTDLAMATGINRRELYRVFSGRGEVIEAAIMARVEELIDAQRGTWEEYQDFDDALVETAIGIIGSGRSDAELQSLFAAESAPHLHAMMAGPYPPFEALMRAVWEPRLAQARRDQMIRTDVTDDELIEWLRGVYLLLLLREDLAEQPDRQRAILRNFLLPALTLRPPRD